MRNIVRAVAAALVCFGAAGLVAGSADAGYKRHRHHHAHVYYAPVVGIPGAAVLGTGYGYTRYGAHYPYYYGNGYWYNGPTYYYSRPGFIYPRDYIVAPAYYRPPICCGYIGYHRYSQRHWYDHRHW